MSLWDGSVVFADRSPTETGLTRFRLILSTFQDGTGGLAVKGGGTLPGWRDFERAAALAFGGVTSENKGIMDVHLPDPVRQGVSFGLSCKMRVELNRVDRDGRVTIELSNALRTFWNRLSNDGITTENYRGYAPQIGNALVSLVHEWHSSVNIASVGTLTLP